MSYGNLAYLLQSTLKIQNRVLGRVSLRRFKILKLLRYSF